MFPAATLGFLIDHNSVPIVLPNWLTSRVKLSVPLNTTEATVLTVARYAMATTSRVSPECVVTENLVVYGSPDEAEDTGALHVFAVGPAGAAAPATVIVTDPD